MSTPTGVTPLSDVDLRLLRVFKTIVEEGGLKLAQAALGVGLPSISKQLADLEARFGVRLCERGQRPFELTPQGEILYQAVLKLFAEIERFEREADQIKTGQRGEMRIGVMDNTITDPLSPLVGALETLQSDDLHLRLSILDPDGIQQRVADGRLEIGIVPVYRQWPGLEYRRIYSERSFLYCGSKHPLFGRADDPDAQELATYAFVEHGYVDGSLIDGFSPPSKTGATAWQVEAVALLLMTGRFLGYLPNHYALPLVRAGKLRQLLGARSGYRYDIAAVYRPAALRARAVRRVLDVLAAARGHEALPDCSDSADAPSV